MLGYWGLRSLIFVLLKTFKYNQVLVVTGKAGQVLPFVRAFVKLTFPGALVGFPCTTAPPLNGFKYIWRIKMRKITFLIVFTLFLLFLPKTSCFAESLPERFAKIVQSLEIYAFKQGIKLEQGESIKDVVALGYLNAVNRLKVPFGALDEKVKKETVEWLSILCWFPIIPPEKKEKVKNDLKKIRKALSLNLYERTLAGLSVVPGFAVSCVGEVLPVCQFAEHYPFSAMGKEIYYSLEKKVYPSEYIVEALRKGKIDYKDLLVSDWTEKYLK